MVLPYGYTVARLNAGKALRTAASEAVDHATAMTGDQRLASAEVQKAFDDARAAHQGLAKVARVVFLKQPGPLACARPEQSHATPHG